MFKHSAIMSFLTNRVRQFFRSTSTIFGPPFGGLWLIVLLYFFWTYLAMPGSPVVRGVLPDPDDYMYLVQVMDWLKGASWFDNTQLRLDPPLGVPIHFSRLAEAPMALFMLGFEKLGLNPHGAAQVMALLYPIGLLAGLLLALRKLATYFVPKEWAGVSAFIVLFATETTLLFSPGHVDHHGLIVLLMSLTLLCLVPMMREPTQIKKAALAGFLMGLQLVIALELLPWLLVLTAGLGFWALYRGPQAIRAALVYALSLFVVSVVGLVITRPPSALLSPDILAYSYVYVVLTMGIAFVFAGMDLAARRSMVQRFSVTAILALVSGAWFLRMFPDLVSGPYGGMDPALSRIILGEMMETRPLLGANAHAIEFITYMGGPLLALFLALRLLWKEKDLDRDAFGLITLLLGVGCALSIFYQRRFLGVTGLLTVIPLTVFLYRAWTKIGATFEGREKVFAEIFLLLLVGPLPTVIFPATLDGRSFNRGFLFFPAQGTSNVCDMVKLERALKDPALYGDRPRLIMNVIGTGPEILFRTPHRVLSAPFHMDVNGNLDATRFFSTPYPEEALAIARRRGVELVVACRLVPDLYMRHFLGDNENTVSSKKELSQHFIVRLMTNHAPAWLKLSPARDLDDFIIYEVVPEESHGLGKTKLP